MPSRTGLIDVRKLIRFKWLSFSFYMAFTTGQARSAARPAQNHGAASRRLRRPVFG
jgi:hypothetical protein